MLIESPMPEPTVLLDGLAYVESPRWHDGRLWFAHWGTGEIVAVDLGGNREITGQGPPRVNAAVPGHSLGWSIDWLPDGRLLITGKELLRREPDGSMVRHADLSRSSSPGHRRPAPDGRRREAARIIKRNRWRRAVTLQSLASAPTAFPRLARSSGTR